MKISQTIVAPFLVYHCIATAYCLCLATYFRTLPTIISYITAPSDHQSTLAPYGRQDRILKLKNNINQLHYRVTVTYICIMKFTKMLNFFVHKGTEPQVNEIGALHCYCQSLGTHVSPCKIHLLQNFLLQCINCGDDFDTV